jgi:hypothetical protein
MMFQVVTTEGPTTMGDAAHDTTKKMVAGKGTIK